MLRAAISYAGIPPGITDVISAERVYYPEGGIFDREGHVKESSFPPITVAKANQAARNILRRYRLTLGQLHGSEIFHGTSSPILVGLAKGEGVLPYGELIKRDLVPFSGANDSGRLGVGRDCISTVWIRDFSIALQYAKPRPWNQETGRKNIARFSDPGFQRFAGLSSSEELVRLEGKKIEKWDSLSLREQELIAQPFPVVIGISSRRRDSHVQVESADEEIGLHGGAKPEEIKVLFVPPEKIEMTRRLLRDLPLSVESLQREFFPPFG